MLTDNWKNVKKERESQMIAYDRAEKLEKELKTNFPTNIEATLSMNIELGETCIRAFVHLKSEEIIENINQAIKFLTNWCDEGGRFFRENVGRFAWQGYKICEDKKGQYEEKIFIENIRVEKCEIKEVTKTVTVYEAICENDK